MEINMTYKTYKLISADKEQLDQIKAQYESRGYYVTMVPSSYYENEWEIYIQLQQAAA